jgi:acetyl esterase
MSAPHRDGPAIRHQALLYPATDRSCSSPSFTENDRYLLTPAMMRWYWKHYIGDRPETEVAFAQPVQFKDVSRLPTATVLTAEYDPLRDEGEAYAAALSRAGVPTELVRVQGQIHGFIGLLGILDAAEYWLGYLAHRIRGAMR